MKTVEGMIEVASTTAHPDKGFAFNGLTLTIYAPQKAGEEGAEPDMSDESLSPFLKIERPNEPDTILSLQELEALRQASDMMFQKMAELRDGGSTVE